MDKRLNDPSSGANLIVPQCHKEDRMMVHDNKNPETAPVQFLGGGHYFDDCGGHLGDVRHVIRIHQNSRYILIPQ